MPLSWAEADQQFYASAAGKVYLAATASSSPAAPAPSVAPPSAALIAERAVPQPSEMPRAQVDAIGVPPALPSTELSERPAPPVPAPTPLRKNRSVAAPRKFTSEGVEVHHLLQQGAQGIWDRHVGRRWEALSAPPAPERPAPPAPAPTPAPAIDQSVDPLE